MQQLYKTNHYLMLKDNVYAHNFKIDYGSHRSSAATIQGAAFNQVNTVYLIS